MANNAQDTLYDLFSNLFGGQGFDIGGALQSFIGGSDSTSQTDGGGGIGSIATTVLKSAFGVVPIISGLLGLFGGDDSSSPPPLVKYSLPESIPFEAADTSSGLAMVDYDQAGSPRSYMPQTATANDTAQQTPAGVPPQITVNVQAMDARSFLDRSSDIAAAVREAMLNLNSINDVVNEL